ncbi:unnamed protein product [Protopolystoma xenopodis]|uniref:Uncharacterized protein n=1 Tax=Protopolystoma xenopodis TaxID=117903 RepID=A0A448WAK2_9PLAT|nr:unnamed protein product [Protopolystoma xenopodis]
MSIKRPHQPAAELSRDRLTARRDEMKQYKLNAEHAVSSIHAYMNTGTVSPDKCLKLTTKARYGLAVLANQAVIISQAGGNGDHLIFSQGANFKEFWGHARSMPKQHICYLML